MTTASYPPPLDQLLSQGDVRGTNQWPNYLELGLGPEHIPDLIRLVTDDALNNAPGDQPEVWAPVHAWRTLGQLRAEAAIEPLLSLLKRIDENHDDFVGDEIPAVLGMIGPAAIPAAKAYLADPQYPLFARVAAARTFVDIAKHHPAAAPDCIAALTAQLEKFAEQDPEFNSFMISPLLDLKAVEAAPVMERAFADEAVDISIVGDWEDAQVELGLLAERITKRPPLWDHLFPALTPGSGLGARPEKRDKLSAKARVKRKQAKKSRKINRKRR